MILAASPAYWLGLGAIACFTYLASSLSMPLWMRLPAVGMTTPGAELLPLSEWPALALEKLTDHAQPLLIQCHHGGRSARATEFLLHNGFTDVTNLAGDPPYV